MGRVTEDFRVEGELFTSLFTSEIYRRPGSYLKYHVILKYDSYGRSPL